MSKIYLYTILGNVEGTTVYNVIDLMFFFAPSVTHFNNVQVIRYKGFPINVMM